MTARKPDDWRAVYVRASAENDGDRHRERRRWAITVLMAVAIGLAGGLACLATGWGL